MAVVELLPVAAATPQWVTSWISYPKSSGTITRA